MFILDTNVAIHLRDGDAAVTSRTAALDGPIAFSALTRVELEGGVVNARPADAAARRRRVDAMLAALPVLAFDDLAADRYRSIVETVGFSRRKIIDRMIAAQALAHDATLVTVNGSDFKDVPGLKLLAW